MGKVAENEAGMTVPARSGSFERRDTKQVFMSSGFMFDGGDIGMGSSQIAFNIQY